MVSTVSDSRRRQPHGHETGFPEPLTTRRDGRRHHLRVVPAGNQRTDLTNSADRMTASTEPAAVHQATRLGSAGRPRGGREHADADVSLCVGAASAVTARPRAVSAIRSIRRAVAAVGAVAPVVPPCHLARSGWRHASRASLGREGAVADDRSSCRAGRSLPPTRRAASLLRASALRPQRARRGPLVTGPREFDQVPIGIPDVDRSERTGRSGA